MAFILQFNAHQVTPNIAPEPVPTGTYPVVIVDSSEKAVTGSDDKFYMEFVMEVISGDFKGRKIYERLNHKNPNQQTRDIAMQTLSSIAHVTGVMVIQQSSQELHNKPFQVKVVKVPRDDNKELFSNNVRGYLDALGYEPGRKPANADAANTNAGQWGQTVDTTQQTQQDKPADWGGGAGTSQVTQTQSPAQQQASTTQAQPDPVKTQAANPWATDQRYIKLLVAGIPPEAAIQALIAQGMTPEPAAPAQSEQVNNAPSPSDIAAQTAAMFAGQGNSNNGGGADTSGGEPTPDWAK